MRGELLTEWRERNGCTRRDLAEILEVSEYTLYRWERGESAPAGTLLDLALEALQTRMDTGRDLRTSVRIEDWDIPDSIPTNGEMM